MSYVGWLAMQVPEISIPYAAEEESGLRVEARDGAGQV